MSLGKGDRVGREECASFMPTHTLIRMPILTRTPTLTPICPSSGRAGQSGVAITLLGPKDGAFRDQLLSALGGKKATRDASGAIHRRDPRSGVEEDEDKDGDKDGEDGAPPGGDKVTASPRRGMTSMS